MEQNTDIRRAHMALAIDAISATWEDCADWIYYAEETSSRWRVTEDDLVELGEALDRGDTDAYSHWCAGCGEEVVTNPDFEDLAADGELFDRGHIAWAVRTIASELTSAEKMAVLNAAAHARWAMRSTRTPGHAFWYEERLKQERALHAILAPGTTFAIRELKPWGRWVRPLSGEVKL